MQLSFIYLDFPFWRAEVGRIALHLGGVDFVDQRISRDEFLEAKETGKLPDGTLIPYRQIPCLVVDGQSIAQTGGISRVCGKISGLYPQDNMVDAALVDQVIDMATDITVLLGPANAEQDAEKKKEMRLELAKGPLPRKISFLEEQLEQGSNDWFVGSRISIADIAVWRLFGWLTSGTIDHLPTDLLAPFPRLRAVCSSVNEHPGVVEWVRQTYPKGYATGNF